MDLVERTQSPQGTSRAETSANEPAGRVGRCAVCRSVTYDATGLSEEELRRLVLDTEGRVLTRLVQRTDGRVMSVDCGHGTVGGRRLSPWWIAALITALALGGAATVARALRSPPPPPVAPEVAVVPPEASGERSHEAVPEAVAPSDGTGETPPADGVQPTLPVVADGVRAPPPRVEVHLAEVVSSWSTVADRRVIATPALVVADLEQRLEPLRACYLEVLETNPNYRGTINTTLFVGDTGQVTRAEMPLVRNRTGHERLMECCRLALRHEVFPWGHGTVSFRLVFAGRL